MNEIKVLISFEKRINQIIGVALTSGDYNSTKIVFDFDRKDGIKVFELKNPKGELVFSKEIEDNEIILSKTEEDGTISSIFGMDGEYIFEVSLYSNDGKLTSDYNYLPVAPEQVTIGDKVVEPYLPIFDELIQKINTAIIETNNLDVDIEDSVITITKKDGTTKTANVKGDSYIITEEDYQEIETNVKSDIQPILENNLKSAKDYTDNAIIKDFKDISFDTTTMTFVFTRHDNTTFTVALPIEQTVKNGFYDEETKELVLVLVSDQEIRIPASGLIDDYAGVDTATIQLVISADNKITANIKAGSISKTLLTTELQEELNGKLNSNLVEQKDLLVTYEDETTETIKLVVYK